MGRDGGVLVASMTPALQSQSSTNTHKHREIEIRSSVDFENMAV